MCAMRIGLGRHPVRPLTGKRLTGSEAQGYNRLVQCSTATKSIQPIGLATSLARCAAAGRRSPKL